MNACPSYCQRNARCKIKRPTSMAPRQGRTQLFACGGAGLCSGTIQSRRTTARGSSCAMTTEPRRNVRQKPDGEFHRYNWKHLNRSQLRLGEEAVGTRICGMSKLQRRNFPSESFLITFPVRQPSSVALPASPSTPLFSNRRGFRCTYLTETHGSQLSPSLP